MLRLELLKVKADLERELGDFSLNCTKCGPRRALGERSRRHDGSLGACGARAGTASRRVQPRNSIRRGPGPGIHGQRTLSVVAAALTADEQAQLCTNRS